MSGSRVLLEDSAAGMLLSVDVKQNLGRVIRQDHLTKLIQPFFESLPTSVLAQREDAPFAVDLARFGGRFGDHLGHNGCVVVVTRTFTR